MVERLMVVVVTIMIVVMIIPVMVIMPVVGIFVPPAVIVIPTPLASMVQFVAPMFGLLAVHTVMLDGFVQLVIGMGNPSLAIVIIRTNLGSASQKQESSQGHGR